MLWAKRCLIHESCHAYLFKPVTQFLYILVKYIVGEQNLPPQNMSLWHEDYFKLVVFEKQKAQEELYLCPLNCLKGGLSQEESYHQNQLQWIWARCGRRGWEGRGTLSKACLIKFFSVSHCLSISWQTFVYQTFVFPHCPVNLSLPFEVPTP